MAKDKISEVKQHDRCQPGTQVKPIKRKSFHSYTSRMGVKESEKQS